MPLILIRNIGQLVQVEPHPRRLVAGHDMAHLPIIYNAFLLIKDGRIADFGSMDRCPTPDQTYSEVIEAPGKAVLPCWCDSHTHIVYAGSREAEFTDRIKGMTYEQIAERGGGILNSARLLQQTPEIELLESAYHRLEQMKRGGTGAVEIKSGYGLSFEGELKILRVIKELKKISPLTIKATFLGAHALPLEYKQHRSAYISLLCDRLLPIIADEDLADFIDVFCERGFFNVAETAHILEAGARYGLRGKIHANELDYSGGVQVGVQYNALSVDHLECVSDAEIHALLNSETMPTLLPSTAFFLGLNYAPARRMIAAGLPIALATDYNPGSSPSGNMPFVLSLACIKMRLLPEEAINAATLNGAYAMDVEEDLGTIAIGKRANVFITQQMQSLAYMPYSFGNNLVERVILNGQ
jgi:imidazolonepropionase